MFDTEITMRKNNLSFQNPWDLLQPYGVENVKENAWLMILMLMDFQQKTKSQYGRIVNQSPVCCRSLLFV